MTTFATFWERVDQSGGPEACWPWTGRRQSKRADGAGGYGCFIRGGKTVYSHRWALELTLGRPLGPRMLACHTCDNPPCCNPAHLFEGTFTDNFRDAVAKGRVWRVREWACPDCGTTVIRRARNVGARCDRCAAAAVKAKRRRAFVAWRAKTPLKRLGPCQRRVTA